MRPIGETNRAQLRVRTKMLLPVRRKGFDDGANYGETCVSISIRLRIGWWDSESMHR